MDSRLQKIGLQKSGLQEMAAPDECHDARTGLSLLTEQVHNLVNEAHGNALALVDVLRLLERLHREITEGAFQEALPQHRQELYKLLRVIEEEGGWPHIPRYKLQMLYSQLRSTDESQGGSHESEEKN